MVSYCPVTQTGGPRCVEADPKPVKAMLYPARVRLVRMDAESPDIEVFVKPPDTTAKMPSRTCEYHEVIHIACIINPLRMVKIAVTVVKQARPDERTQGAAPGDTIFRGVYFPGVFHAVIKVLSEQVL